MKHISLTLLAIFLFAVLYGQVAAISGPSNICVGSTGTFTDATPGGVWSSSNPAIAVIGSTTGVATGITAGTLTLTYTVGMSYATATLVVDPVPATVSGPSAVCVGSTITLSSGTPGGTWASANPLIATVGPFTGVLTGVSAGATMITYSLPSGCYTTRFVTVNATPAPISGTPTVCVGATTTLSCPGGGTWSSSTPAVATVGTSSGIVTAVSSGTTTITYTLGTGCTSSIVVTANPLPGVYTVTGGGTMCAGGSGFAVGLTGSVTGINYQLYNGGTPVGSPVAGTGAALSFGTMTTAGTYTVVATNGTTGCSRTMTGSAMIVVNPLPVAYTVTGSSSCGTGGPGVHVLLSGSSTGVDYQLYRGVAPVGLPIAGTGTAIDFGVQTLAGGYTVIATDAITACTSTMTGSATVTGNMISGFISYTGTPSDSLKVWLIQFNPSDSSIAAQDSMYACMATGSPYFQFDDKVAGNYLVKAKLMGTIPGTSGYIPTYGLSNAHWDTATTIVHATGADSMHINMIYGTVPAGPGFIAGYVVAGAGKGTSGEVPVEGMLVYLKDASGHILTYTYTDVSGAYSFSGIANGTYVIYPVDYKYYTTPSPVLTLSTTSETITAVDFKQHTSFGTITPFVIVTGIQPLPLVGIYAYPNPASGTLNIKWTNQAVGNADVVITDITGREVYKSVMEINAISGQAQINISVLKNGIYFMNIKSGNINYSDKLVIQE
jgi:Secretion system C-terminal sorting domain/SdrD B-like domain